MPFRCFGGSWAAALDLWGFLIPEVAWLWWGRGGQTRPVCWGHKVKVVSDSCFAAWGSPEAWSTERSSVASGLRLHPSSSFLLSPGEEVLEHQPQPPGTTKQV